MQLLMSIMPKSIFIKGKIQKGHGVGKKMGFPTLNIAYEGMVRGIFVGRVFVSGKPYKAAVHVGPRPTFNDGKVSCEGYLIDCFAAGLSAGQVGGWRQAGGADVEFELLEKIRDVKKFDNLDELKSQMRLDVEFVKNWYNRHGA